MLSPRQIEIARDLSRQYLIPLDKAMEIIADVEQLILDGKIERAKDLLIENELSVSEIAHELGFEDVHYFSRAFKKWTGMTPAQYRESKGS